MSKKKAKKHTILEAQRAQQAVSREGFAVVNATTSVENVHTKNSNFSLAIPSIKKDLAKDFIFAVLSIALLMYLKESRLGFSQLSALFAR